MPLTWGKLFLVTRQDFSMVLFQFGVDSHRPLVTGFLTVSFLLFAKV